MENNNLLIDLHVHSEFSYDCYTPIEKIIKISKKLRLNGIAITDHNTIVGGVKAKKFEKQDFKIIIGSEITLENGLEILGLFLNEDIKSKTFFEVYDEIKRQDGIIILPHPFRRAKYNISKISEEEFLKIKIIEGINAGNYYEENEKAKKLAKEKKLILTAGSDAHHYSSIGKAYTIFEKTDIDLRKQINKGMIKVAGKCLNKIERQREFLSRELKIKNYKIIKDAYVDLKDKIK